MYQGATCFLIKLPSLLFQAGPLNIGLTVSTNMALSKLKARKLPCALIWGEWMEIGSISEDSYTQRNGFLSNSSRNQSNNLHILIKVDKAP